MIAVHDVQNVHQLPLIGVNALHLNVEHRIRVNLDAVVLFDVVCKSFAPHMLNLHQLLKETLILHMFMQRIHLFRMPVPYVTANDVINECGQLRIRPHKPAPMRNTVGFVVEFARRILVKIPQRC